MSAVGTSQGLVNVISNGLEDAALELLSLDKVNLDEKDPNGASLLHLAAKNRMEHLVHKLVLEKKMHVMQKKHFRTNTLA